ncbi:MAG TPA: DUF2961 domain-containing protein [Bacteroidales bacterium]|nr:DUF2961 domain-containing protein [Bacteroidales bacterium]HQK70133.1 DUF2961 domain-containing protein [Bacteroidales bacterium]
MKNMLILLVLGLMACVTLSVSSQSLESLTKSQVGISMRAASGNPFNNTDALKDIGAGETRELAILDGPGKIVHMWFVPFSSNIRWPRALVLRIYWDGSDVPSVETPMGDFFAVGNGMMATVNSLPVKVSSYGRGMNCYWQMPFKSSARITITNEAEDATVGTYFMIDWVKLPKAPRKVMYFHARYHQEIPQMGKPYTFFVGEGNGHYVGTVLSSQNGIGHWFGEGDDSFYIDGETIPSISGTGTEDYFNEAWNMRVHSSLYTGCTVFEPRAIDARITAYRWHIPDPVIFKKSLRFEIERTGFIINRKGETISESGSRPDNWSSVSYWYQDEIAKPWCEFPKYSERVNKEVVLHLPQVIKTMKHSDGVELVVNPYNRATYTKPWFQALNNEVGSWIEIPFEISEKGLYSMTLFQHLREDNGIWKLFVDGKELYEAGESQIAGGYEVDKVQQLKPEEINTTLDFYNIFQKDEHEDYIYGQRRERKIGLFEFEPGEHTLRLVCVGANPLSAHPQTGKLRYNLTADVLSLRKLEFVDTDKWVREISESVKVDQH